MVSECGNSDRPIVNNNVAVARIALFISGELYVMELVDVKIRINFFIMSLAI